MRILVADDSIVMRKALKMFFTQLGHSIVAEAADGDQAYMYYEAHKPDLMTLDLNMPGSNGMFVLKKVLEKDSYAKIIIVSSVSKKSTILEAMKLGAKYYILKPFNFERIQSAVNRVFNNTITEEDITLELDKELDNETDGEKVQTDSNSIFGIKIEITLPSNFTIESYPILKEKITTAMCLNPSEITFNLTNTSFANEKTYQQIKKDITEELLKSKIKISFLQEH